MVPPEVLGVLFPFALEVLLVGVLGGTLVGCFCEEDGVDGVTTIGVDDDAVVAALEEVVLMGVLVSVVSVLSTLIEPEEMILSDIPAEEPALESDDFFVSSVMSIVVELLSRECSLLDGVVDCTLAALLDVFAVPSTRVCGAVPCALSVGSICR